MLAELVVFELLRAELEGDQVPSSGFYMHHMAGQML